MVTYTELFISGVIKHGMCYCSIQYIDLLNLYGYIILVDLKMCSGPTYPTVTLYKLFDLYGFHNTPLVAKTTCKNEQ